MRIANFLPRWHKRSIKLYWFRHQYPENMNFGDELSREIVERLSGKKVYWADKDSCEMVAIGSLLQAILSRKSDNRVVVWGTGLMFDDQSSISYDSSATDIRAVRGKLTAGKLGLEHKAVGDPGLLADLLYKPSGNPKKIGIVPHYVDTNHPIVERLSGDRSIKVINVYDEPAKVVAEIASCELIISSSLHGIISAHAFGVPAYWVELSKGVAGEGFKFRDHYSVFDQKPAKLSAARLASITKYADELIGAYEHPKNIDSVKQGLIDAFPRELRPTRRGAI
jgi:pyruvyltransferase